jgi:hypothetical protein
MIEEVGSISLLRMLEVRELKRGQNIYYIQEVTRDRL